jgi:hypothetical protein
MKRKKVFCQDCRFENGLRCMHPKNVMDDSYAPKNSCKHGLAYINKNNDCKWFVRYRAAERRGKGEK